MGLFPFQWLNEEKIIQSLVELIHPHQDEDVSDALRTQLLSGRPLAWLLEHPLPLSGAGKPFPSSMRTNEILLFL